MMNHMYYIYKWHLLANVCVCVGVLFGVSLDSIRASEHWLGRDYLGGSARLLNGENTIFCLIALIQQLQRSFLTK